MLSVFWSLSNILHHPNFIPGTYEFRIIASLFNIKIIVVEGHSSIQYRSKWFFEAADVFLPYQIFQINPSIDLAEVYVLRDDQRNYYYFETQDKKPLHLAKLFFLNNEKQSRIKHSQLVSYCKKQNLKNSGNHEYRNLYNSHTDQDIAKFRIPGCHPNILFMILHHPMAAFSEKPVKNCQTMIAGFQTLNPKVWIDDSVIHSFFEVNRHKQHPNTWIVTPFEAFQFRSKFCSAKQTPFCNHRQCKEKREEMQTFYCKEYDKKYKQCNRFSAVVLLQTTHWVVLEFDLDKP